MEGGGTLPWERGHTDEEGRLGLLLDAIVLGPKSGLYRGREAL